MHVRIVLPQDAEPAAPGREAEVTQPGAERPARRTQLVVLWLEARHAEVAVDLVAHDEPVADALATRAPEPVVVEPEHEW